MSATNETPEIALPLFTDEDKPTWRGDFNGAMTKIDTSIKTLNSLSKGGFSPYNHGALSAPGNIVDDGLAIQAAIDEASAAGGGSVRIPTRMGATGKLIVKKGVLLEGESTTTLLLSDTDEENVGIVALDGTFQLQIGETANGVACGVRNLLIDGNNVGGGDTDFTGLVRVYGVNTHIENLFTFRSASDGLVFPGTQNSLIIGGESTQHAGCALVLDHGPGGLTFIGGYYGTSDGGALVSRLTVEAGHPSPYPFGTSQCQWYGTLFEAYADAVGRTYPFTRHVEWRAGQNNLFAGCNFTAGADNSLDCAFQISSVDGVIPSILTIDNGTWWAGGDNPDVIKVVGSQILMVNGIHFVSDNGVDHPENIFKLSTGVPTVISNGYWQKHATTDYYSMVSGALVSGSQAQLASGSTYILNDPADPAGFQVIGTRKPSDSYFRGYVNANFAHAWFSGGVVGIAKAILGLNVDNELAVSAGRLVTEGGHKNVGQRTQSSTTLTVAANGATVVADSNTISFANVVTFYATETCNVTNLADGDILEVLLISTIDTTITFQRHGVAGNVVFQGANVAPGLAVAGTHYFKFIELAGKLYCLTH